MSIKTIACCTDFSENAGMAFLTALEMAEKYQARLLIIHVLPPVVNPLLTDTEWVLPDESRKSLLLKLEEKMQQEYGSSIGENIDYDFAVLNGHVSSEILKYLEEKNVDLVVIGAYGLTGMGLLFFGSVTKRIAHHAPCSVLIVREQKKT